MTGDRSTFLPPIRVFFCQQRFPKLASKVSRNRSRTGLLFFFLSLAILLIAVKLAPSRAFSRLDSLAKQLRLRSISPILNNKPPSGRRPFISSPIIMAAEKYAKPPHAPPLFTATPESILADVKKANDNNKSLLDKIAAEVTVDKATFANVLLPILVDQNNNDEARNIAMFYQSVSADADLRDASTKAEEILDEYFIESSMREDIFKLIDAAYASRAEQNLDYESLHILEKKRAKLVSNGLLLQGADRDRFKEIQKRISQLCIQANKNLNDEKGGMWFTPEQLDGVPKDDIDLETLEKGTGENEGKLWVTFKYTHLHPLLKNAKNDATRRDYSIGESNKAMNNVPLFSEIISLRTEAALLLGYPNHASVIISQKMAKTAERVTEFLGNLRSRLTAGGEKETAHLLEYKKRDCEARGLAFDGEFYSWDTAFYSRQIKEQEYSVDENEVSQYFPIGPTFAGMLKIFEDILGFVFVEVKKEDRANLSITGKAEDVTWHEDVLLYSVWNEESAGGNFIGYLYLDFHPRDNKYSHNAEFTLVPGFAKDDGSRSYPVSALVCNFSKPSATKPGLLKHHEVVTLFHELGHGIHDLSSTTKYAATHGTMVSRDFVEAPSQMLENWCWTPDVLQTLSQHWDTKQPIPEDLVQKLVKTKHLNSATGNLAQLLYGTFDMQAHMAPSVEATKGINYAVMWNTLRREISGVKGPEAVGYGDDWGNRYSSFTHFIGGYDAGYYGYLYSSVFSFDMFYTHFKANPMNGEQGRRYRNLVLARGGSKDELEILKDFLGREPNSEAFYEENGLA